MRIAFLDSWMRRAVDGSGTAVSIGGLEQALASRGVRVTRIGPLRDWPSVLTPRRLLFNLQLPALLSRLHYDLIVGFDIDGVLYSQLRNRAVPYICNVKGVIAEEMLHEQGCVRRLLWSLSLLERLNARSADGVLTDTTYCAQAVVRNYGVPMQRIGLVPAGIDLRRWRHPTLATDSYRDPWTILCVAHQYPRKHVADLLRAFAIVRRSLPQARLVVIGDGPEHTRLRMLAAELGLGESAQLLGGIPNDNEVLAWYRRASIFCLPSVQECLGIVLLEAMASGLPVVATTAAAVPEVVPDRRAGLLVPPSDIEALAAALHELLESPELRAEFGAFGSTYVERFAWNNIADQFLDQVSRLVL